MSTKTRISIKTIAIGSAASLTMLGFYFLTIALVSGLPFAIDQFLRFKYFLTPIIIGFGTQSALYYHILTLRKKLSAKALAGSGATSGVSMVICCAHRLTDVLPLVGIGIAATFLVQYQVYFFVLGILSNAAGIAYLLKVYRDFKGDPDSADIA